MIIETHIFKKGNVMKRALMSITLLVLSVSALLTLLMGAAVHQ